MGTDQRLRDQRKASPNAIADVLVTCTSLSPAVERKLSDAGMIVQPGAATAFGVVAGRLRLSDLDAVEAVPEVQSIEPDETASALNGATD